MKKLGKEQQKILREELKASVGPIVGGAERRYRRIYPAQSGSRRSRRGIRGGSSARGVAVLLGSKRYPYLIGQEWGSGRFKQFPVWDRGGRFYWPAIQKGLDGATKKMQTAIDRANRRAFPEP